MSKIDKFVYHGSRPTNVCYNGVSFPVATGDIIACPHSFIAGYLKEGSYKKVVPGSAKDNQKPRHTFSNFNPVSLRKDPTGGLPMKSSTTRLKKVDANPAPKPPFLHIDETEFENPYDMTIDKDKPKTEISTFKNISVAEDDKKVTEIQPPEKVELDVPTVEEVETAVAKEEAGEGLAVPEDTETTQSAPAKSALRKMTKPEIFDLVVAERDQGCPAKPAALESFNAFDTNSTRGPMFEALWNYFGYDGE